MDVGETSDRVEQAVAQPAFVRSSCRGRNQVDEGLPHKRAVGSPGDDPGGAFASGKPFVFAIGVMFAREKRNDGFIAACQFQRLTQVAAQAVFVLPGFGFSRFGVVQFDMHTREQDSLGAQQVFQFR